MADTTIPSFAVNPETKLSLTIPQTNARIQDQGYTYNQTGFTYTQAGVTYGGLYQGNQDISPAFFNDTADLENRIELAIAKTNATLTNQGYTYNQAGLTYAQVGVQYGGLSANNQDLAPAFFNDTAAFVSPAISGIVDMYTNKPTPGKASNNAPGWFMFLTLT